MTAEIEWIDGGREPQCAPNPAHPNGIDVDAAEGRHGCKICGYRIAITTAGRPDDPRSVKIPCQLQGSA